MRHWSLLSARALGALAASPDGSSLQAGRQASNSFVGPSVSPQQTHLAAGRSAASAVAVVASLLHYTIFCRIRKNNKELRRRRRKIYNSQPRRAARPGGGRPSDCCAAADESRESNSRPMGQPESGEGAASTSLPFPGRLDKVRLNALRVWCSRKSSICQHEATTLEAAVASTETRPDQSKSNSNCCPQLLPGCKSEAVQQ